MVGQQEPVRTFQRVSNACKRCRQNKQRCDVSQPCSNCVCSDVPCERRTERTSQAGNKRAAKRPRIESEQRVNSVRWSASRISSRRNSASLRVGVDGSREITCSFPDEQQKFTVSVSLDDFDSALALTNKLFGHDYSHPDNTSAIPGSSVNDMLSPPGCEASLVSEIIGYNLPTRSTCDELLVSYFDNVHWFSLVIYEPTFRASFARLLDTRRVGPTDLSFLLLALTVLAMGSWYHEMANQTDSSLTSPAKQMAKVYLRTVKSRLMDIMGEESLDFIRICILIGSHDIYHGGPKCSFSLLGAAIKTAQAMSLHRGSSKATAWEVREQRSRIWWTLYTWDRFATTMYGRPFGINDADCDVQMPQTYSERVRISDTDSGESICFSEYQVQLNKCYQIASPLMGRAFEDAATGKTQREQELEDLAENTQMALDAWKASLPSNLSFESPLRSADGENRAQRIHDLQRLALKLTYHNLVIIVNRSGLVSRRPLINTSGTPEDAGGVETQPTGFGRRSWESAQSHANLERIFRSANAISQIGDRAQLFHAASRTHLVSFMGLSIFSASVVIAICALRRPLSDTAQEAKRCMLHMLMVQRQLSMHSALNAQCSLIVERLVQLIIRQETRTMLQRQDVIVGMDHNQSKERTAPTNSTECDDKSQMATTTASTGNQHTAVTGDSVWTSYMPFSWEQFADGESYEDSTSLPSVECVNDTAGPSSTAESNFSLPDHLGHLFDAQFLDHTSYQTFENYFGLCSVDAPKDFRI